MSDPSTNMQETVSKIERLIDLALDKSTTQEESRTAAITAVQILREAKLTFVSAEDLDRAKKAIDGATAIARNAQKKAQEKLVLGAVLGFVGARYAG
jgi:hypothetical protein